MRRREYERGSALAEFALISTAALTLIFGIIEMGRAMYTYHLVSEAARLGSRYAIVQGGTACAGGTPDPLQSWVSSQAPGINPNVMLVHTTCTAPVVCSSSGATGCSNVDFCQSTNNGGPGCLVTVSVTYPFTFLVPLVSTLQPNMTASSTLVITQQ